MTNIQTEILRFVLRVLATVAVVLMIMIFGGVYGRQVEAYLFPVMLPGEIISAKPIGPTSTQMQFEARKVRGCDWVETKWYIGELGGRAAAVASRFLDRPQVRPAGMLRWEGLIVELPERTIRESSYSITKHRCHPLWLSESVFFVGDAIRVPENEEGVEE